MTTNGKTFPVLARAFSRSRAKRSSSSATSPPRTTCFDIFSPPPGHSEVISHVDRLSSNETKIAPRSVRIAVGASGRSATVCMVASRVGVATSLCQSASRYPPPHGILKENLLWVRTFDTIEELQAALVEFATRYNETWLVARHGYRTPAQVRADQCGLDRLAPGLGYDSRAERRAKFRCSEWRTRRVRLAALRWCRRSSPTAGSLSRFG